MRGMRRDSGIRIAFVILLAVYPINSALAGPIEGPALDTIMAAQEYALQEKLAAQFDESEGYLVTGPFDPRLDILEGALPIFNAPRVLVPDKDSYVYAIRETRKKSLPVAQAGYNGHLYEIEIEDRIDTALIMTYNQNRFLIWLKGVTELGWNTIASPKLARYSGSVLNYFLSMDSRRIDMTMPPTEKFKLPESVALFAPDPEPVFPGNKEYSEFLRQYKSIDLPIAQGDTLVSLTGDNAAWFRENAPYQAYPDKSIARIQEEYREFIERDGDFTRMKTLSKELFDEMSDGEYIFAINVTGKIRFAPKLSEKEIINFEKATGQKPAIINHAFLFPGEPVLSVGSFTIDASAESRLAFIDAYSEHYFYSKIDPSLKEKVARKSDHYLTTLGHLLKSLDNLGIDYIGARVSKFGDL